MDERIQSARTRFLDAQQGLQDAIEAVRSLCKHEKVALLPKHLKSIIWPNRWMCRNCGLQIVQGNTLHKEMVPNEFASSKIETATMQEYRTILYEFDELKLILDLGGKYRDCIAQP